MKLEPELKNIGYLPAPANLSHEHVISCFFNLYIFVNLLVLSGFTCWNHSLAGRRDRLVRVAASFCFQSVKLS